MNNHSTITFKYNRKWYIFTNRENISDIELNYLLMWTNNRCTQYDKISNNILSESGSSVHRELMLKLSSFYNNNINNGNIIMTFGGKTLVDYFIFSNIYHNNTKTRNKFIIRSIIMSNELIKSDKDLSESNYSFGISSFNNVSNGNINNKDIEYILKDIININIESNKLVFILNDEDEVNNYSSIFEKNISHTFINKILKLNYSKWMDRTE